ncbi:hypothetical protein GGX14DRAFT_635902 [Mycena pura]|uniref:Uncharacterized protein n=1 Tax=Mycena pura TaxID=153505 RepID=A0AAD6V9U1_9AGAR|nr:hypothetical protein GGX14DRAFT_635902 [Mycena pura]
MSSQSPPTDPWLERFRLDGMILDGFTYGFAANARFTEDIWINLRRGNWNPSFLIANEFDFWCNRLAIDTNFVMVWLMNLLLLYRCFVIWSYDIFVVALMSSVYLAIIALSIAVMIFAALFFNLNVQLSFLVLTCTFNLLFTVLVSTRLLTARNRITSLLGAEHAITYTSITATLVESAALYFIFDVICVVTYAVHSDIQNLILLENCLIQGISQLLIIVRVAEGREYDAALATHAGSSRISFRRDTSVAMITIPRESGSIMEASPRAVKLRSLETRNALRVISSDLSGTLFPLSEDEGYKGRRLTDLPV